MEYSAVRKRFGERPGRSVAKTRLSHCSQQGLDEVADQQPLHTIK
jgi:hypothetical protein